MEKTNLLKSICLLSNRSDVADFCELAVGMLAKIIVRTIVKSVELSAIRVLSDIVFVDATTVSMGIDIEAIRKCFGMIVCLLPPDCSQDCRERMNQLFRIVVPIPCDIPLIQTLVRNVSAVQTKVRNDFFPDKNLINVKNNLVFNSFLGSSDVMTNVKLQIEKVAASDSPVLILGETGTGKTTIARLIHDLSNRKHYSFITESIPKLQESFPTSTLFGTNAGSYTDAITQSGLFKLANKGTLFLDEIGFANYTLQGLFLTTCDSGCYRTMGSNREEKVDVRLIFATNADIRALRVTGQMREDFYQRIAPYKIELPALRDHLSDIEEIILPVLEEQKKSLSEDALEKLMNYEWPGNVRELLNCIKRACTFCPYEEITSDYIFLDDL